MDEHTWTPDGELPARLAAVLDAARRPGDAHELAGEAAARAAFREFHRAHPLRRRHVLSKVLSIKAAVVAVGAFSVVGVAAAATDNLPGALGAAAHGAAVGAGASEERAGGADQAARLGLCEAAGQGAAAERGPAAAAERGPAADALATLAGGADRVAAYCAEVTAGARGSSSATGPDVLGPAGAGLCRAWQAGGAGEEGSRELAVAFAALARAAGGSDRVDAYCTTRSADASTAAAPQAGTPSASRHAPTATPSHPNGPKVTPGGPGYRPAPAPTAPPGRKPTGTP